MAVSCGQRPVILTDIFSDCPQFRHRDSVKIRRYPTISFRHYITAAAERSL
jgi:hypothetical protein